MCYSLYLVHLPVAILIRGILAAAQAPAWLWHPALTVPLWGAASLWLAWQFHVHVERRFMGARVPAAPASLRPAALAATTGA